MESIQASIIGGSGYTGGELIRLLHSHPRVEIQDVTSRTHQGRSLSKVHPHLRHLDHKFTGVDQIDPADVLFLATPHGISQQLIDQFLKRYEVIIDLSSDFRLNTLNLYQTWYGDHQRPELLSEFSYGLVELHREEIQTTNLISSAGCNATVSILALYPLVQEGIIDQNDTIVIDVKVGSSEGGKEFNLSTHHPERVGTVRSYQPTGHRHSAEIIQELGMDQIMMSATAIELVRGSLATIHVLKDIPEKVLWKTYRKYYGNEPFIRLICERSGHHRLPDPKLLSGTNYCDIGFQSDQQTSRTVLISAIDNLMKGSAGQAVQAMNLRFGFNETMALEFTGLFP